MGRRFGRARSLALDISPLRESPAYRALWIGQTVSLVGTQMRYVAVPYEIFRITGSNVAVGLIGLAEVVPLIIFSILGGAIADAVDRRRLVMVTTGGMMATSAALAAISIGSQRPSVVLIYVLIALSSGISALEQAARTALAPSLVRAKILPAVMALRQVAFQVTQIVGPAVGGVLIALLTRAGGAGYSGVGYVYLIDCASFVAALIALQWVPRLGPAVQTEDALTVKGQIRAIREGFNFAFRTPLIQSIFLVDLSAMIFGMPRAVFPAIALRTFHSTGVLGLLYAAPAAGALIGALSSGWVKRIHRQGVAVILAVTVWGSAIAFAGLSLFSLALTLLFLAIAGAADVVSAVFRGTMLLVETPDALRGRVSALNLMVVTGGPRLGDVEAGLVAGALGAPASIVIGGLGCLIGTGLVAARFRSMRDYRAEPSEGPASGAAPM